MTRALILVPTRELAEQVSAHLKSLLTYCEDEVMVANVSSGTTTQLQRYVLDELDPGLLLIPKLVELRTLLSDKPDIVVATPSRALALLQAKVHLLPLPS